MTLKQYATIMGFIIGAGLIWIIGVGVFKAEQNSAKRTESQNAAFILCRDFGDCKAQIELLHQQLGD